VNPLPESLGRHLLPLNLVDFVGIEGLERHFLLIALMRDTYHLHNMNEKLISLKQINSDGNIVYPLKTFIHLGV